MKVDFNTKLKPFHRSKQAQEKYVIQLKADLQFQESPQESITLY